MTATLRRRDDVGVRKIYLAIIGLASLGILLQAVWAGIFIREGEDYDSTWVEVHARCADASILLTVVALGIVIWRMRERRDLLIGTAVMAVALVVEAYLGGLVGEHPAVTVLHFPLALVIMALAVWLPMRARHGG